MQRNTLGLKYRMKTWGGGEQKLLFSNALPLSDPLIFLTAFPWRCHHLHSSEKQLKYQRG